MTHSKNSSSSRRWLNEHFSDPYVKRAQEEGYRARAAYKLLEIQQKDKLLKPGMVVVDLGAAPGSWAQVAKPLVGKKGRIIGIDLLPIDALPDVEFIQGDFTEEIIYQQILERLSGQPVDVVLSDMAPNASGMKAVDQPRAMYLVELALDFAKQTLCPGGSFLVKVFQGEGFEEYLKAMRAAFNKVVTRKPKASRPRSTEVYLLGRGFRA